ncbi:heptaprenyl diphosphate synthase component 1 [Amphibacillus cookii]|uniref:heptaprenyl diphosphate synthase component 1 n=1 Tax=Amphibacillus cookii TaxID=767787 RepID=UPI0019568554|nr:hypothetical protein [Amphibacillus cookii]
MELKDLVIDKLKQLINQKNGDIVDVNYWESNPRLAIFTQLIEQSNWTQTKKIDCIAAVALLQLSLDIHDLVSNQNMKNNSNFILHGDLLSGQHYKLLVAHKEIKLLKALAKAIKDTNAIKAHLAVLNNERQDVITLLSKKLEVDMALVYCLIRFFNLTYLERFIKTLVLHLSLTPQKIEASINHNTDQSLSLSHKRIQEHLRKSRSDIDMLVLKMPDALKELIAPIQVSLMTFYGVSARSNTINSIDIRKIIDLSMG